MEYPVNWYYNKDDHEAQYLLCDRCVKESLKVYIEFQTTGGPGDECEFCGREKNDGR